jgi:hypothetical protein
MEQTTFASRLRYLDADDVDDSVVDYDGLEVIGPDGDKVGDVEGFIVDAQAARVHYVVVDSGGWFRSRRFLLPVGHATIGRDRTCLRVDVTKNALSQYPEFDEDRFREFSDDDLRLFERTMSTVCCPDGGEDPPDYGAQPHYTQPEWWTTSSYPHERLRPVDTTAYRRLREAGPPRERVMREYATSSGFGPAAETPMRETIHDSGRAHPVAERLIVDDDDEPRQSER